MLSQIKANMNHLRVDRKKLSKFTDLPNIGPSGAKELLLLGYKIAFTIN